MANESDEILMARYAAGDYEAFQSLYERYSGRVYQFLRRRTPSKEIADELFQKVFMKLHETKSRYQSKFLVAPWIFLICRQTLIDAARREKSHLGKLQALADEPLDAGTGENPIFETVLSQLNPQEQELIDLRYFEGVEFEELSKRLGVSKVAVRKRMSRALQNLKKLMRPL